MSTETLNHCRCFLQSLADNTLIELFWIRLCWKMPRLSQVEREQAIGMLEAGKAVRLVARRFHCTLRTINRLRDRYAETGTTNDRPRSGRPRVTSQRQDRQIVRQHVVDPFRPATRTAARTPGIVNPRISYRTVLRRLSDRGIKPNRAYVGMVLNEQRRRNRRAWVRYHSRGAWRHANWRRVVLSDESRLKLFCADGRKRVF